MIAMKENEEEEKRERTIWMTETTYKILCLADAKNCDASLGLEKLASMYTALTGPVDFNKLDIKRAQLKAKQMKLL
jgi:hypothetical protein